MIRMIFMLAFMVWFQYGFSKSSLLENKAIYIEYDQDLGLYCIHTIEQGQTLYSISRNYRSTVSDILLANLNLNINDLKIGEDIRVPIDARHIKKQKSQDPQVATYYKVKNGETLFAIAKRYFGIGVRELIELNGLENEALIPGQLLYIGQLQSKKAQAEIFKPLVVETDVAVERKGQPQVKIDEHGMVTIVELESSHTEAEKPKLPELDGIEIVAKDGTAFWNKADYRSEGRFVLHRQAKVNSIIEITNPMSGVTVRAKVIGELPSNLYSPEIDMIISPAIAKELKVLDSKFYVQMRYSSK